MCGRYSLHNTPNEITERFAVSKLQFELAPRYNIAPTQTVAVITNQDDRRLAGYRWGLIPFWAKDPQIGSRLINARAETLAEKPSFKRALAAQRCLIPADGFYEWKKTGAVRQPYHFRLRTGKPFAFAGLWDEWAPSTGPPLRTCTVITVQANDLVAPVHDRMPAILLPEDESAWLDKSMDALPRLMQLLRPFPSEPMDSFPVSRRVNSPKFDDPLCLSLENSSGY